MVVLGRWLAWTARPCIACGTSEPFTDGGPKGLQQLLHTVRLEGLQPGQAYSYRAGGGDRPLVVRANGTQAAAWPEGAWSEPHTFTARRAAAPTSSSPCGCWSMGTWGWTGPWCGAQQAQLCRARRRDEQRRQPGSQVVPDLLEDAASHSYDAVLHLGDHAYDLHLDNGQTGDAYMRMMQPLAASTPMMSCPGNHEVRAHGSLLAPGTWCRN